MKLGVKISFLASIILLSGYISIGAVWLMRGWGVAAHIFLYVSGGIAAAASIIFFALKKDALLKTAFVLVVCLALVYTAVIILNCTLDLNEVASDGEKIGRVTALIESAGGWSIIIYISVQILQVVLLPLPSVVCYLPGVAIWGPLKATLLASAGVIAGSVISYFLGRIFGRKIVVWIAGKENTDKYADYIGRRGKILFVIMQILPFFPDDILCMVAGMTKMYFPFFLVTTLIVRPAIAATYCYLGSGSVIPFSGWGIPVWIAVAAVCAALAVLSFKYQDKFESRLKKLFGKHGGNGEKTGEDE